MTTTIKIKGPSVAVVRATPAQTVVAKIKSVGPQGPIGLTGSPGGAPAWGDISGTLTNQTDLQAALDDKVDDTQLLTNVPAGALFTDTDTIYDDTAIQAEVDLNTAKVSNIDHPLVETAVPIGAVFTDTVYNATAIQAEVDLNTAKVGITPTQASDITTNNDKVTDLVHPLVETAVPIGAVFTDTATDISGKEDIGVAQGILDTHEATHPVPTTRDARNQVAGSYALTSALHAESHTVVSHSDTTATGPELDELTNGSITTLHSHLGGVGVSESDVVALVIALG